MRRPINKPSETSAFLGIGVGKQAKVKADAAIKLKEAETAAALAIEQAKRDTLTLQLAQAKAGFDPVKDAAAADLKKTEVETAASNTIYYVIGAIVIVLIIGAYFITKSRK